MSHFKEIRLEYEMPPVHFGCSIQTPANTLHRKSLVHSDDSLASEHKEIWRNRSRSDTLSILVAGIKVMLQVALQGFLAWQRGRIKTIFTTDSAALRSRH